MRIPHGLRAALASQGAAPPAPSSDANFENVSLLLHGDGTNGAQNNTFVDDSTNNFTITRNGNTTQGTFSPFSPTGWSAYFDGTGDYLSSTGSGYALGSGDYTVELWVYHNDLNNNSFLCTGTSAGSDTWQIGQNSGTVYFYPTATTFITGSGINLYAWHHIAATRSGSTVRLFIDGVLKSSTTDSTNLTNTNLRVGFNRGGSVYFNGYISNVRIVKGTAVYTSAFTPPTSPLTAITNTSLLTLQDNRFKDNSTNNFTITRNGDTKIEAFSPFNPTAAYSASTHGGSGYFDGSSDKIYCTPSNLTGQFTIEGWWYANAFPSTPVFFGNWGTGCLLRYQGNIQWYMPGGSGSSATYTLTTGQWYHMAVTRDSSDVVRVFANGVQLFSLTNSASITMTNFCIGSENTTRTTADIWNGYISGFRILNGTCLYSSDFTPPTSPPTAIANTNLLVNFTNAGIIDNASKNVLETVGNAQISTSVKKFGTGSMYFDGTGDYLTTPASTLFGFGTGAFTVEGWFYSSANQGSFSSLASLLDATGGSDWQISVDSNILKVYNPSAAFINASTAFSNNAWHHFAWTRQGTTNYLFLNGTQYASVTDSTNWDYGQVLVGSNRAKSAFFNGYIDDLRITKGVARYTANFTPPTAAFFDL